MKEITLNMTMQTRMTNVLIESKTQALTYHLSLKHNNATKTTNMVMETKTRNIFMHLFKNV
jgi:hypothetical protein